MRCLGRLLALLIIVLIIPSTACAFWLYNANRVLLDVNTYKNALQNSFAYTDFLTAVLESFTSQGSTPRNADSLLKTLPPEAWVALTSELLPTAYANELINQNLDAASDWLNGHVVTPNIVFNFTQLKERMAGQPAANGIDQLMMRLARCSDAQSKQLVDFSAADSFNKLPLCNPSSDSVKAALKTQLATGLSALAQRVPDHYDLLEDMHSALGSMSDLTPDTPNRLDMFQLFQGRAALLLQSRLLVLLFLIPIALVCLIVIVTIRSRKEFFRWLGWALILSGVISLLPVFLLPLLNANGENPGNPPSNVGTVGQAAIALVRGIMQTLISTLTLSVLLQVAALIVVGLIAVFISVLLASPDTDLTDEELAAAMVSAVP